MYNATLSNKDCIFDSRTDFETFREALDWALNRGESYKAYIEDDNCYYNLSITGKTVYDYDPYVNKWFPVELDKVEKECRYSKNK